MAGFLQENLNFYFRKKNNDPFVGASTPAPLLPRYLLAPRPPTAESMGYSHNLSPKSPSPGRMYRRSFRQSSMAPVTIVTSGNSPLTAPSP